jgi:hypothetical protein
MTLNKPAKEIVVDLFNVHYQQSFAYAAVTLSDPEVMPYDAPRNTRVVLDSANGDAPLSSPFPIYYDRVNLTAVAYSHLGSPTIVPQIEDDGYTTTLDLLPQLNALLQTQLDEDDIVSEPLPVGSTYPKNVVVRVKPTSLAYLGSLSLMLTDNVQS